MELKNFQLTEMIGEIFENEHRKACFKCSDYLFFVKNPISESLFGKKVKIKALTIIGVDSFHEVYLYEDGAMVIG